MEIKFIDLFAGLGGFRTALELLSQKENWNTKCVLVSEINEKVLTTYKFNFNSNQKAVNIRDLDVERIPDHDFLFAGFPCQTFSNAGKKKGFLDEIRGTLFYEIAKILKHKKPKFALLENVKHIVNHDKGKTWKIILDTIDNLGYIRPKEPLILNPIDFGIPQDRSRVFIPLILKEKMQNQDEEFLNLDFSEFKNEIFKTKNNELKLKEKIFDEFLEKNVDDQYYLNDDVEKDKYLIDVFDAWNEFLKNVKVPNNKTLPVIWLDYLANKQKTLTKGMPSWKIKYLNDMWNIYDENKTFIDNWLKKWKCSEWKKRERKFEWQAGVNIKDIKNSFIQLRQSGIRCRRPISFPTLVAMVQIPIIYDCKKSKWRKLTPRETANLQSYPKNYKLFNEIVTDNPQSIFDTYMQIGNSVNVKIVEMVQKKLLTYENKK